MGHTIEGKLNGVGGRDLKRQIMLACIAQTNTVNALSVRSTGWYMRVALHRLSAGFADQPHQFAAAQVLAGGRAGVVIDAFLHQRSVDIVGAEALRDLRDPGRHHHPIGLDVRDVVQHQARHRDLADIVEAGG